ncbi:HOL1 substrate-H+ antiporter [Fusarium sp. NRRL 52700]|nr:HOL1 substrate-H+ antiporter [Fusarium sp. NRRL 52700]
MIDVGKEYYVRAKEPDQVHVPQPSQVPQDPLNWSPFWKFSAIFCVSTMTFTQGFPPLALAPMFPDLSSRSIGFLNFSILVGALIGFVTAGPFSDWVSAKATTRNGGIREPEMSLPATSS